MILFRRLPPWIGAAIGTAGRRVAVGVAAGLLWGTAAGRAADAASPSTPADGVSSTSAPPASATESRANPRPRPSFWQGDDSLTEAQRADLRAAYRKYRQENRSTLENLRRAQRELEEAVFAPTPDPAQIRERAAAVGRAEGELAVARTRLVAELRSKLTPEQVARLKSLRGDFEWNEHLRRQSPSANTPGATESNSRRRAGTPKLEKGAKP